MSTHLYGFIAPHVALPLAQISAKLLNTGNLNMERRIGPVLYIRRCQTFSDGSGRFNLDRGNVFGGAYND
jgi:hypothetical protein